MLENSFLLLWRHLDFYVNVSPYLPLPETNSLGLDNAAATSLLRVQIEALNTMPIPPNEIKQLKAQAAAALSQTHPGQRETTLSLISKLEQVIPFHHITHLASPKKETTSSIVSLES